MAMTRRPLSASISRTVETVSYRIEFPTFLLPSVFVATWKDGKMRLSPKSQSTTHLRQNIVHRFARLRVILAQQSQQTEDLDLEEWVRDPRYIVLRAVTGGDKGFQMSDEEWYRLIVP